MTNFLMDSHKKTSVNEKVWILGQFPNIDV